MRRFFQKHNRSLTALLLTVAMLFALGGCTMRPRAARTEDGEKLFRLGFAGEGGILNPYTADTDAGALALSLLYDTLFTVDPASGEIVNGLCTAHDVTDNTSGARRWELTLRSDARWSDGTPVTAYDVEFSLQSQGLFSALYSHEIGLLLDTVGLSVTNGTTFVMVAWGSDEAVLSLLSRLPILPEHIWNALPGMDFGAEGLPTDFNTARASLSAVEPSAETMISSGMYTLSIAESDRWCFRYNAGDEKDKIDAQAFEMCFNLSDPVQALSQNRIDGVYNGLSSSLIAWNEESGGCYLYDGATSRQILLEIDQFGEGDKALKNAKVRQALSLALDRGTILSSAYDGGTASDGFLNTTAQSTAPAQDQNTAASLLSSAGYTVDKPLKLELLYCSEDPCRSVAAEQIRASLETVGVTLTLKGVTAEELAVKLERRDFDLLLTVMDVPTDPYLALLPYYWNDGRNGYTREDAAGNTVYAGWNECGYGSDAFDMAFEKLMSAQNTADRDAAAHKLNGILQNDAPAVVIGYPLLHQACSSTWLGGTAEPTTGCAYSVTYLRSFLRQIHAK